MNRRWATVTGIVLAAILSISCGASDDDPPAIASPSATFGAATPGATTAQTPQPGAASSPTQAQRKYTLQEYPVPAGSGPHDVAPAADGRIWYTAQRTGKLGLLDPANGKVEEFPLGSGSAPHGVIVGPDGAAWVTDSGLNAIVRVKDGEVAVYRLPADRPNAGLNTAVFDKEGVLWFTGNSSGTYGSFDPATGAFRVFDAPRGPGPYGIAATPSGDIYYASLQGSHIARINRTTGEATVLEPPTARQGSRRVWADSRNAVWVSEWNSGNVGRYTSDGGWKEWTLPGTRPQTYAVYVDTRDQVWLTDFGANAIVRFDPATEAFEQFPLAARGANVRQLHGRAGEVWGAESGADRLVVIREN